MTSGERARATMAEDRVEIRRRWSKSDTLVKRPNGDIGVEMTYSALSPPVRLTQLTVDDRGYLYEGETLNPRWQEILDNCVLVARQGINQLWPLYYPKEGGKNA
jgi:hypothetical protein